MNLKPLLKYAPPPGPVLGLLLIGLVMASAFLYYRAVKIQRYLEPALALTRPRNDFVKHFNAIFVHEFGTQPIPGLGVKSISIFMARSYLFTLNGTLKPSANEDLRKIARIFLALMQDSHTRTNINLIMVIARYPANWARDDRIRVRDSIQRQVGLIQDEMFLSEPELKTKYASSFAVAVQPVANSGDVSRDFVEFRIVPSEYLHIEVLEKLRKYTY